jgi:hypothetical protein
MYINTGRIYDTSISTRMADQTSCGVNQILCGSVLLTKKKARNDQLYVQFLRKSHKVCIFENEWDAMKQSGETLKKGMAYTLSHEKKLVPDTWMEKAVVWIVLSSGFKFYMDQQDYDSILLNAKHIDAMMTEGEGQPAKGMIYYSWTLLDERMEQIGSSLEFFKDRELCVKDGEKYSLNSQELSIETHNLYIESPTYLIYHIFLYILERRVLELSQTHCMGCKLGETADYKSHLTFGCTTDWETKLSQYLDDAKKDISERQIIDVFTQVCKNCELPLHPHMYNIVYALTQYGNINIELMSGYKCPELLKQVIKDIYEQYTSDY